MIVASFFAPRFDQWGCDYVDLLRWVQASCDAFGLRHIVISDRQVGHFECAIFDLPENLMLALLDGQRQFLASQEGPVLLIGADCLICRDPRVELPDGCDMAVTRGPYEHTPDELNTGAIWCASGVKCAPVWAAALACKPEHWGQDQIALDDAIKASGLAVADLPCWSHNRAPDDLQDRAGLPVVAHFRGSRKSFMRQWAWLHLGLNLAEAA